MFDASKWRAIVVANINFTKYDEICSEFATEFFIMSMYKWKGTEKNNIHANHDTEDSVKSMCQTDRISKFMIRYTTKVEEKQKKRNIHSRGKCKHVAVFFSLLLILSHESDPFLSRAKSQRIIPSHEIEMISLKKKRKSTFSTFSTVECFTLKIRQTFLITFRRDGVVRVDDTFQCRQKSQRSLFSPLKLSLFL